MNQFLNLAKYFLLIFFFGGVLLLSFRMVNFQKQQRQINYLLNDSIAKLDGKSKYLENIFMINNTNVGETVLEDIEVYKMKSLNEQVPLDLSILLNSGKKKLVIRYTSLGCNACTDITVKLIKKSEKINADYDIIFLVDFTDHNLFLKWVKVQEIDYPTYWIPNGRLPFNTENNNESYIFIQDNRISHSFFIPKSIFKDHIESYLSSL